MIVVDLVGFQLDWVGAVKHNDLGTDLWDPANDTEVKNEHQPAVGDYVAGSRRGEQGI